jgi:ATP-dependent Zn protease
MFERAAAQRPAVLFLDECDALPNRSTLDARAREWWATCITEILISIASCPRGVLILAATNVTPDVLDPALIRAGRIERSFEIRSPDTEDALESVFRFHLRGDLAGEDLSPLARVALGATPAMVLDYVHTARRKAKSKNRELTIADLADVLCPPDKRHPDDIYRTAVHEAAHICVAIELGIDTVTSASIIPKDGSAGRVVFMGFNNVPMHGRDQIEKVVQVLLAGRAAELVLTGGTTGGVGGFDESDLGLSTRLIAGIHGSLGMGDTLAYRSSVDEVTSLMTFDPEFRRTVDDHLRKLAAKVEILVLQRQTHIEHIAKLLVKRRYMTADEVREQLSHFSPLRAILTNSKNSRVGSAPVNWQS